MPPTTPTLRRGAILLAGLPLAWLLWAVLADRLGANPIEAITRFLGDWALYTLLLTLACTPLQRWLGWGWTIAVRRTLGLYSFAYASLHLASYLVLDQFFYWPEILADLTKRPYITIGMLAYLLLLPLAITSSRRMQRRLGRRWKSLHRLIYPIAGLGVLHFILLTKADLLLPGLLALILALLLLARLPRRNT